MNHGAVIASEQVTGLVLAGGRGSRMGGVDKGLQVFRGMPLAMHALMRLAPQVSSVIISANRNLAAYESMGAAVFPDSLPDFAGPLAGFLTGLSHCETPYLATVPCDSPLFPANLIRRLGAALLEADAEIAMAAIDESGRMRAQPVFCLLKCDLLESLVRYTRSGERKIDRWTAAHRCVEVPFDERAAFSNVNTLAELRGLEPKA